MGVGTERVGNNVGKKKENLLITNVFLRFSTFYPKAVSLTHGIIGKGFKQVFFSNNYFSNASIVPFICVSRIHFQ